MHPIPAVRTATLTTCFVVLMLLACAGQAGAASLANYRHRVEEAIGVTAELRGAPQDEGPAQREQSIINSVARIREILPAKETVEFGTQGIVADNTWLHEALQQFENADRTREQRALDLARMEQRLRALDEQLAEVERGQPAANDKDGEKGRLAEILRRPDFNKPVTPEGSALSRLWNRFVRWLSSLFPKSKPMAPGSSGFLSGLLQIVIVIACLGALAFLIWKLAPRYLKGRRGNKKQKREARIVLGERLEPDQTAADLLAQAEALARSGDLRAAIRKAYIALLCELGDRKIVSLAQHKTNRDYLNSVRERTRLYGPMRQLTSSFELHWYGFQPANESDWNEFRSGYQQALKAGPIG